MNLYELTKDLQAINKWFEEAEENPTLLTEDFYTMLDKITLERDQKLINCRKVIANFDANEEAITVEINRLTEARNKVRRKREILCEWIGKNLFENEKFECPLGSFSWRTSEFLNSEEGAKIPKSYQRIKIEPDKNAIKAAIKAGKKIKGWFLETRKNLQVK